MSGRNAKGGPSYVLVLWVWVNLISCVTVPQNFKGLDQRTVCFMTVFANLGAKKQNWLECIDLLMNSIIFNAYKKLVQLLLQKKKTLNK